MQGISAWMLASYQPGGEGGRYLLFWGPSLVLFSLLLVLSGLLAFHNSFLSTFVKVPGAVSSLPQMSEMSTSGFFLPAWKRFGWNGMKLHKGGPNLTKEILPASSSQTFMMYFILSCLSDTERDSSSDSFMSAFAAVSPASPPSAATLHFWATPC